MGKVPTPVPELSRLSLKDTPQGKSVKSDGLTLAVSPLSSLLAKDGIREERRPGVGGCGEGSFTRQI